MLIIIKSKQQTSMKTKTTVKPTDQHRGGTGCVPYDVSSTFCVMCA